MNYDLAHTIALLCNPLAGSGRSLKLAGRVMEMLQEREIPVDYFDNSWPSELEKYTSVWIVGGDGTLNYFINKYPEVKLPLVLFRGGTGNDVHWLLYREMDLDQQFEVALNAKSRMVDAGRCNEKLFINGIGIGFEGEIARATSGKKKLPGKTSFMMAVLRKIFFYRSQSYVINIKGARIEGKKLMISVTNGKRAGGGFYVAPTADPADGMLDLVTIEKMDPLNRLRYLPVIEKGRHMQKPFVFHKRVSTVTIESEEILAVHADGEFFPAKKLEIEVLPGRFRFVF